MIQSQKFINNVKTVLAMDTGSLTLAATTIKVVNTPELNNVAFQDAGDYALMTVRKISTNETEVIKVRSPNNGASTWDGIGTMPNPAFVTFTIVQREYESMVDGRVGGITLIDNSDSEVYFGITAGTLERALITDPYGGGGLSLVGRRNMRDIGASIASYGLLPQLNPHPVDINAFNPGSSLIGMAMSNPIDLALPVINWQPNHAYAHGTIIAPASRSGSQYMRVDDFYPYDDTSIYYSGYTPSSSGPTEPNWLSGPLIDDGDGRWLSMFNGMAPARFEVDFSGHFMVTSIFVYAESVTGLSGAAPVISVQDGFNDGQLLVNAQTLSGGKTDRWWKFEMPDGTLTRGLIFFVDTAAGATSFRSRLGVTGVLIKGL